MVGRGRPRKFPGDRHSVKAVVLLTPAQAKMLRKAARRRVVDFSEWARGVLLHAAAQEGKLTPFDEGWTPQHLVEDVLKIRTQMCNAYFSGPFTVVLAREWRRCIEAQYCAMYDMTIRERLTRILDITEVVVDDTLTDWQIVLKQKE